MSRPVLHCRRIRVAYFSQPGSVHTLLDRLFTAGYSLSLRENSGSISPPAPGPLHCSSQLASEFLSITIFTTLPRLPTLPPHIQATNCGSAFPTSTVLCISIRLQSSRLCLRNPASPRNPLSTSLLPYLKHSSMVNLVAYSLHEIAKLDLPPSGSYLSKLLLLTSDQALLPR